jgi:4-hydroxy-3-polyprenylbenzoate decarboxylase
MPDKSAASRLVVAITGASGAPYAVRFLEQAAQRWEQIYLCISDQAAQVLELETGRPVDPSNLTVEAILGRTAGNIRILEKADYFSPPASGSFRHSGMVIIPCSMGTAGRIAHGISNDLITRAADVCLKERRRLILVPREMPLSLVHLRNLTLLAEAGAVILPASPGFYDRPESIADLVDHVVGRVLQQLGVDQNLTPEWQADE